MISSFDVATDPIRIRLPDPHSLFGSVSGVGVVVRQSVVGASEYRACKFWTVYKPQGMRGRSPTVKGGSPDAESGGFFRVHWGDRDGRGSSHHPQTLALLYDALETGGCALMSRRFPRPWTVETIPAATL